MDIVIQYEKELPGVSNSELVEFMERIIALKPEKPFNALGICFVDATKMKEINRTYRKIKKSTDILSFPGENQPAPDGTHSMGDLVISVPDAQRQAQQQGHSLVEEVKHLLLHGYLHLLGFDHETDQGEMNTLELSLREKLGLGVQA